MFYWPAPISDNFQPSQTSLPLYPNPHGREERLKASADIFLGSARADMTGVCYQFAETGDCNYGTRCKFSHVLTIASLLSPLCKVPLILLRVHLAIPKAERKAERRSKRKRLGRINIVQGISTISLLNIPRSIMTPIARRTQEFYRMCDHFTWGRKDEERADAHEGFKEALVHQFNGLYGTEVDDIHSWRGLTLALDIFPLPENVAEAKKVCYQRVTPDHSRRG